ncbi:MAG: NAD(+)/NADH kinase [Candidatus Marinimicrobia bacterium]|jgi:predicted polyphosphate/ATP-dependent NAD kinase|nr:NAD(+)/NADH kinase [Candidatus Neomarinimicrobiota bacterium]
MDVSFKNIFKLGLVINPIAGMGGKTGLKGSDGSNTLKKALSLGAKKESAIRAEQALLPLKFMINKFSLITCSAEMGEKSCKKIGLKTDYIIDIDKKITTGIDTIKAVKIMARKQVSLILFSGGDGTACDIFYALQDKIPILGIPAGVKMHSSVFGTSPNAVGSLVSRIISNHSDTFPTSTAEIMDLDEDMRRYDQIRTRLIGYATIPSDKFLVQNPKSYVQLNDEESINGISEYLENKLDKEATYIVGPGRTTQNFLNRIGVSGTLLGVDVLKGRKLIGRDVNSRELEILTRDGFLYIISGIIGGQGFLFGRGNQQITAEIIQRVKKENILIIASTKKIYELPRQCILIDTGNQKLDNELAGYVKVQTDRNRAFIIKLEIA